MGAGRVSEAAGTASGAEAKKLLCYRALVGDPYNGLKYMSVRPYMPSTVTFVVMTARSRWTFLRVSHCPNKFSWATKKLQKYLAGRNGGEKAANFRRRANDNSRRRESTS